MRFKLSILLVFVSSALFLAPQPVRAVCPVCTVAVGAGIGISRALGVDDTVTGVWIGGLLLSSSLWLANWLSKRPKLNKPWLKILGGLLMYGFALIPLYVNELSVNRLNTLFGVDKIILGTAFGTVVFAGAVLLNDYLKKENNNKVYFPFQKVVIPVVSLALTSMVFYLITKTIY